MAIDCVSGSRRDCLYVLVTVETVLQRELDGYMGADVSGVPGRGGSDRQRLFTGDAGDVLA